MRIAEALSAATEKLSSVDSPRLSAEILLSYVLSCPRYKLITERDKELSPEDAKRFFRLVEKRGNHFPLQYLTGKTEFYGIELRIREGVFIPRAETELLVEELIKILNKGDIFLDIGTGAGCIPVAVLRNKPAAFCFATDINPTALQVARENIRMYGLEGRCQLFEADIFPPVDKRFDIIVSNPPYIKRSLIPSLQEEVRYEPLSAIDGGETGLDVYRRILSGAPMYLREEGYLLLETDPSVMTGLLELAESSFKPLGIKRDIQGLERVILLECKGTGV
ncbi:peptide chain release factor N(5)-glutamine methyltransferase [bacterium]|nr:peptide chain release factor N(5)-glutamine methyltransferase [bacterium]